MKRLSYYRIINLLISCTAASILCLTCLISVHAHAAEKKRVAVLQFNPVNTPQSYSNMVRNYAEMKLHGEKDLFVLEREQINAKEDLKELRKYGCNDSSCAVLAGRSLEARYVVYGTVSGNRPYTITMRVLSVTDEKILSEYSESYGNIKKTRKTVDTLTKKIITDIRNHSKKTAGNGRKTKTVKKSSCVIDTHAYFSIFQPLGKLHDLVKTGFGLQTGITLSNIGLDATYLPPELILGFDTGFFISHGRDNDSDRFSMLPFLFSAGYYFSFYRQFYVIPRISLGAAYLRFYHAYGHGFDMDDNSTRHALDPALGSELVFGYHVYEELYAETTITYSMLLESSGPVHTLLFQAGIRYRLDWPGPRR